MFVLEPLESALARGATIQGEIVGFGMSADACDVTKPSAEGAAMALREALRDQSPRRSDWLHQCPWHRDGGDGCHRNPPHPLGLRC